jgi:hypothetical protein
LWKIYKGFTPPQKIRNTYSDKNSTLSFNTQEVITMRTTLITSAALIVLTVAAPAGPTSPASSASPIVDTGQDYCYDLDGSSMPCPSPGDPLFGQDANYITNAPAYQNNGDGTITDLTTGLMWAQTPVSKMTWADAVAGAASFDLGGYTDWRLPTIKELYSLIDFNGITGQTEADSIPYLDTTYFDFTYGDVSAGERMIDAQYWSSTEYVSTTMNGSHTVFGVNFADGRIKGYGTALPNGQRVMTQFVRYVRGETGYGENEFVDNGDGTITDLSTGLVWMQQDSGVFGAGSRGDSSLDWSEALAFCENLDYAGQTDWRLPDAKELQGIVDYTRSPDTTQSAAIDPAFSVTPISDELGQTDYPFFWTSTTHLDGLRPGDRAVYIAFGEALGYMNNQFMDVHGAGAQRSDLKTGDPASFPLGMGPQGDVQRIYNYARCVRGGDVIVVTGGAGDTRPEAQAQGDLGQGQNPQGNQQGQPPQGGQGQGQPPQTAIDACAGQSQGAPCSFNTPNGTIIGTCTVTPENVLACVPAGGSPPGSGGN